MEKVEENFSPLVPHLWNSLPQATSIDGFERGLESFVVAESLSMAISHVQRGPIPENHELLVDVGEGYCPHVPLF